MTRKNGAQAPVFNPPVGPVPRSPLMKVESQIAMLLAIQPKRELRTTHHTHDIRGWRSLREATDETIIRFFEFRRENFYVNGEIATIFSLVKSFKETGAWKERPRPKVVEELPGVPSERAGLVTDHQGWVI
jgi:hypothetical protein